MNLKINQLNLILALHSDSFITHMLAFATVEKVCINFLFDRIWWNIIKCRFDYGMQTRYVSINLSSINLCEQLIAQYAEWLIWTKQ